MAEIKNIEIWYWPKKDEILRCLEVEPGLFLMFKTEDRYYFHVVSKKQARANGLILMGKL